MGRKIMACNSFGYSAIDIMQSFVTAQRGHSTLMIEIDRHLDCLLLSLSFINGLTNIMAKALCYWNRGAFSRMINTPILLRLCTEWWSRTSRGSWCQGPETTMACRCQR